MGKGCGDLAWGSEKFWMSLIKEKSPTVSGMTATGTLMGMGMHLYMTLLSNSCVSLGTEYTDWPSKCAFVPAREIPGRLGGLRRAAGGGAGGPAPRAAASRGGSGC